MDRMDKEQAPVVDKVSNGVEAKVAGMNGIAHGTLAEGTNGHGVEVVPEAHSASVLERMVGDVITAGRSLDSAMAEIEAAVIRAALKQQRGNRSAAARQLQLPRQTLQDRMKKHGLWSS